MVKILACVCFLMGSSGFGLIKVREYKKRYNELVYIRYILNTMLIEIEHQRGTFGETCLSLSSKIKQPYSDVFLALYQLLEKERTGSPVAYWETRISKLAEKLMLNKEETAILRGVIRCVDGDTVLMPLEVIRQSMVEWDKAIIAAERIWNERSKVTLCLSVTVGLLLCITII